MTRVKEFLLKMTDEMRDAIEREEWKELDTLSMNVRWRASYLWREKEE